MYIINIYNHSNNNTFYYDRILNQDTYLLQIG